MTFGYALKIPQTIAKEGLIASTSESTDGSESSALPSKIKFYASFCQLHYIIGEVLETFYISEGGLKNDIPKGNQGKSFSFDKIARLLRIESDLNDWASNLHPFFRKPSEALDTTPSKHVTREANVLRARLVSRLFHIARSF